MKLQQLLPKQFTHTLNLSNKNITQIDKVPDKFRGVKYLHLSNNRIKSLDNIDQFSLISLSLANNLIDNIDELKKVNKTLENLSLTQNPLNVYDYFEICVDLFPKLKRLDGQAIDRRVIQIQKDITSKIQRWMIPFLYKIDQQIDSLNQVLQQKLLNRQISNSDQAGIILKPDWKLIDKWLQLDLNISNLSQIVTNDLPEKLDQETTIQLKKLHYNTFKELIKIMSSNHYSSFIDYLIQFEGDYYQTFIKIQPPQTHIAQDMYAIDDKIEQQESTKVRQLIPNHLQQRLNEKETISNTYRKVKQVQYHEQQEFYQYFPVYTFKPEYIQSIVQIFKDRFATMDSLVKQIIQLRELNQEITQRRKPKKAINSQAETPLVLSPKPQPYPQQEKENRNVQIIKLAENQDNPSYEDIKKQILQKQKTEKFNYLLSKLFQNKMKEYFRRIQDPTFRNLDFYELHRLRNLFKHFKRILNKQRAKRQKFNNIRQMAIAFKGWKRVKWENQKDDFNRQQGCIQLKRVFLKKMMGYFKLLRGERKTNYFIPKASKKAQLQFYDAPIQDIQTIDKFKFKNYDIKRTYCSVCDYQFK